jgi:cohesin loading factor subunit SCC2
MLDEDDTVKELAVRTMEDLWFQDVSLIGQKPRLHSVGSQDKSQLLSKVTIIMGVSGNFKDRQSPLEDMLHRIMVGKEDGDVSHLRARYVEVCDTLIDGLVDASDLPGFVRAWVYLAFYVSDIIKLLQTVINCIRTIHLFVSAYPQILSASKASTLLPYLKNPASVRSLFSSDHRHADC